MIFCDACYNCTKKSVLDSECDSAKVWWNKYHVKYVFSCGAVFHPDLGFAEVYAGCCRLSKH